MTHRPDHRKILHKPTISRGRSLIARTSLVVALWTLLIPAAPSAQEPDIVDRWRDTLLYGIDSEIEPVLTQIRQSGDTSLDEQIVARFVQTPNPGLRKTIVDHFTELESTALETPVRELLLEEDVLDNDLLRVAAAYLSRVVEDRSEELLARYAEIAQDADLLAASVAIDAIGRDGSPAAVALLLDLYTDLEGTDLRGAVLRALGETGSTDAVPLLTQVAADEFEEGSLRQDATQGLGRIGDPESLDLLTGLLEQSDSVLRAYATAALGHYAESETGATLENALRDSFWRVRVAALEGLAEQQRTAALPAVAYKARRDPEQPVRQAAIRTLATFGDAEGLAVLREIADADRASEADRILAITQLVEHDPEGSRELLAEIVSSEWESERSRVLDTIGKAISSSPNATFAPIYVKLLEHPNFIVRIYGIRGIGGAGIGSQAEQLRGIARENPPGLVRRSAIAALKELGIEYDPEQEAEETADTDAPATEAPPATDESEPQTGDASESESDDAW